MSAHAEELVAVDEPEGAAEIHAGSREVAVEQWETRNRSRYPCARVDPQRADALPAIPSGGAPECAVPVRRAPEIRLGVPREQSTAQSVVAPQLERVQARNRLDPQRAAVNGHPHRSTRSAGHRRDMSRGVEQRRDRRRVGLPAVRRRHQPHAGCVRRHDRPPQPNREADLPHEPPGPERPTLQQRPAVGGDVVQPERVAESRRDRPPGRAVLVPERETAADVHRPPWRVADDDAHTVAHACPPRERGMP